MDGRFLLLSTAVDPGLLISVMSPSLKQGCAALVSSHSAAGGSLGGLELIWTQPACIQDALGMQGRLRAGCKGGEAGNLISGGRWHRAYQAQACAEGRGGGMKQPWSLWSDVEPLHRSCAELLSEGKITCHTFRVSWRGASQHW